MSPTIVSRDGIPILSLGAHGGTKIITCVVQTILNYLEYGLPLYESVAAVRFHHQWRPDVLRMEEPGVGGPGSQILKKLGYGIQMGSYHSATDSLHCGVMAVAREGEILRGVSEPRDVGVALGH